MLDIHEYSDNAALVEVLATEIAAALAAAVAQRGRALLAVSGGATPRSLFERLSQARIDWPRVMVTQVDERWVPESHADSNAGMIRECLLQHRAAAANFVSLKTPDANAFTAEARVAEKIAAFAGGIDVTVLGMGEDGHTASFFPGADTLDRALAPGAGEICAAVRPPVAPHDRMTLTLPALLRSRRLFLHLVGSEKREVLERAMDGDDVHELPVRAVIHQQAVPLEVYYAPRS